jgi:hypothetical protein
MDMQKLKDILTKSASGEFLNHEDKTYLFMSMADKGPVGDSLRAAYGSVQGPLLTPLLRQESNIRRIYKEQFTNGQQIEFPVRSKRIRAAWFGADRSHTPMRQANSDNVYAHCFPIQAGIRWTLKQIKTGNYSIVEGLQNDMVDSVRYQEEAAGWGLVKAADGMGDIENIATLTTLNSVITDNKQGTMFSMYVFNEVTTVADLKPDGGREISDIYMSPRRYSDMKHWVTTVLQDLDDGTRQEMMKKGPSADTGLWGVAFHKVRDPEFVDDTKLYAFASNFGIMAIDEAFHVIDDGNAKSTFEQGIIGREEVGFAITDLESCVIYNF